MMRASDYTLAVIALIDYGMGNLRSVQKALARVGADVQIVNGPKALADADAMVLPGVGAFDDCIRNLQKQNLFDASREFIASGKPFLGICLGYQALFEGSDEGSGKTNGLGIFRGRVVRFPADNSLKVPQIGWNQIKFVRSKCPLLAGLDRGEPVESKVEPWVYFVHSYFPKPKDATIVATETDYGAHFASMIWDKNVFATQFHPEKSQAVGLQMLKNFVKLTKE